MSISLRVILLGLLVCAAAPDLLAQVPPDLQQAVRERQKAVEAADATTWDRLTSTDFTLVAANGRLSTKAERIAALKQQKRIRPTNPVAKA
jgi:hypothetical protein